MTGKQPGRHGLVSLAWIVAMLVPVTMALVGWRVLAPEAAPAPEEPLLVAAAASLQFAASELGKQFEAQTGQPVLFTYGSSGSLSHQIKNGAPVDLYAPADIRYLNELLEEGRILAGSSHMYARGTLVLVTRRAGVHVERIDDLLHPEVTYIAMANPEHAPYGLAAKQALVNAGLWEVLQPKLVYGESVSQAMQFVQSGNAEAGLIALSVAGVPELRYSLVDDTLYEALPQAIGVVEGTGHEKAAQRFIDFIDTPEARSILERYGYPPPD